MRPQAFYKQAATVLKPFYKLQGKEFLIGLQESLESIGLENHAEAVQLAAEKLEAEQ